MKIKTISGIILILIGIISAIYAMNMPVTAGSKGMLGSTIGLVAVSLPIMIAGVLLLSSVIGASIYIIGAVLFYFSAIFYHVSNYQSSYDLYLHFLIGLLILGILYGTVEGIIKLIKHIKK